MTHRTMREDKDRNGKGEKKGRKIIQKTEGQIRRESAG